MSDIIGAVRPFGIAIDYDDTFTSCPETWTKVIDVLRTAGAHVVCVTSRRPETPVTDFPGDVFYASGRPKWEVMHENRVDIRVWIDDQPEYIGRNPTRQLIETAARTVTLMLPPELSAFGQEKAQIAKSLELHGLTHAEEIEPKAGCRRFRLS